MKSETPPAAEGLEWRKARYLNSRGKAPWLLYKKVKRPNINHRIFTSDDHWSVSMRTLKGGVTPQNLRAIADSIEMLQQWEKEK